ncbi:uncharacterized protein [Dermacentor albipictus]|uniref:uncharacterized protein isoform X2 n=1 Tax=Dermacentor albipictus TaxID=60249 RepID=UPI0031FCE342
MATPSNGATAEPVEASAPSTGPPHLRPALKPSLAASPPCPFQSPAVPTAAQPVKAVIGAATTAASTAAHAAASAAATLGSLAMLQGNSPGGRQGTSHAGGDQSRRQRTQAGRARSARREKRKRRALRALGDPMESACVALLVLCALLVIGVLAYLLRFAQADAAGVGGARKRLPARPNITADADTTTGAAMIVLPALGGATDSAKGGARNIAAGNGSAEGASTIS